MCANTHKHTVNSQISKCATDYNEERPVTHFLCERVHRSWGSEALVLDRINYAYACRHLSISKHTGKVHVYIMQMRKIFLTTKILNKREMILPEEEPLLFSFHL